MLRDLDRTRAAWWAFGVVLAVAIGFVVYSFIGTVVFGIFIYYATRPLYRRLRRRIRPASLAVSVSLFALALPALGITLYAGLVVVREVQRLTRDGAVDVAAALGISDEVLSQVRTPQALLGTDVGQYLSLERGVALLQQVGSAVDTLAVLGVAALHLFVMVAIAFYLLRDDHRLIRWASSRLAGDRGVLEAYLRAVDRDFTSIFFGNILNAVFTGTIGVIAYTALNAFAPPGLGIPAAALVGLLAGIASLVPVVGMKLVYVPVAVYLALLSVLAEFEGLWFVAAFAGVSFVVVDTIPDLVLRPYVSGRSLHVGTVMLAYTLGPLLFGWYGIFLLPMVLVLVFNFARIVLPELVAGEPVRPFAVDPGTLEAEWSEPGGRPATGDADVDATDGGFEFGGQDDRTE